MFALGRRDGAAARATRRRAAAAAAACEGSSRARRRSLVRGRRRRDERGAAAVEAALVFSLILVPFMAGLFQYGHYFWQAQRTQAYAPRIPTGTITGSLSCDQLVSQVKAAVSSLAADLGAVTPIPANDITVIADALPTVGVMIKVSVRVPVVSSVGSVLPLPGAGAVTTEFTQRLEDVVLSSGSVCR